MQWYAIHLIAATIIDISDSNTVLAARRVCKAWYDVVEYLGEEADMWPRLLYTAVPYLALQRRLLDIYLPWYASSRARWSRNDVFLQGLVSASAAPAIGRLVLSLPPRAPTIHVLVVTHLFEPLAWLTGVPLTSSVEDVLVAAASAFSSSDRFGVAIDNEFSGIRWTVCGLICDFGTKLADLRPPRCRHGLERAPQQSIPRWGLRGELLLIGGSASFSVPPQLIKADPLLPADFTQSGRRLTGRHSDACVV